MQFKLCRLSVCDLSSYQLARILRHNGPPSLQSFPVMNVNRQTMPIRMLPPLIAAPHRIISSSASPIRNLLPRVPGSFQPVRGLVSSNRMPHDTVVPPLVSLGSVTIPVTMLEAQPDQQEKHPVIIDVRSTPPNIYPMSNTGVTNGLPPTRLVPTIRCSNTSSSLACSRPAIEPASFPTALRSVVPVDTSPRPSANVQASRQAACSVVASANVALSLRPSTALISGQMMPLPHEISSKLDLSRPVSIKVGSRRILLDTDSFVKTSTGISIAMPPDLVQQVLKPAGATTVQKDTPRGLLDSDRVAAGFSEESKIINVDSDSSLADCLSITSSISESSMCSHPDQKQLLVIERHTPFMKLNAGVESLQRIFSCLGVVGLLQASMVCGVWRHLAVQQHLVGFDCVQLFIYVI